MNIVCRNGHLVSAGSKFCNHCGDSVVIVQSQAVSATSPIENEDEPLQPGTFLRERYIIQQQLGQGGFGRTYLAEDTGRFREKCVIKEFMPVMKNTATLKKAEELFQREAATLHQLEHPQIPRFWEIFRQEKQIFIVVDYIEGRTYKELLEQRLQQGQCFSDTEILELLQNLLPILTYLHNRGVVHRDISPDNIILRAHDHLPVLIDMGGVKQVALEVSTLTGSGQNMMTSLTCVGKVGYAPDEQLRLGLVAPHSDLYALAVSVLVLMTGKKPQQLLDPHTLQWFWENELRLNPLLIKTLSRMLALRPSSRFQSAQEVLQVLNPIVSSNNLSKKYSQHPKNSSQQATQPSNIGRLTFVKQNWQAIPNRVKFLVPALVAITVGLIYVFWKYQPILLSLVTPTDLSRVSNLQLRSMREVQNVPQGLFNYGGAPAFAPVNSDNMKDAINRAHPEFRLRYTEPPSGNPGSSTGIEMLIKGELTFAQSARTLEDDDYNKARARGFSLEQVPIAIDGVVFYTHPSLTIPGLSVDQLQAIFRGQVTNWQQVGGPNIPIVAVGLDPKITSALKLLLGSDGDDIGSNVKVVRDFTSAIRKVAATPGGISYASAPLILNQKTIRSIAIAKTNTKHYVQPFTNNKQVNRQAFQDGTYPMTRRFFIVIRRDDSVDEKAGIAYASMLLSKEGQGIIEQTGLVAIR
ncbi:MAG: substrate-binding domain-containing protein [Brasilonema octagenarum HA4186-MV1]|uniref:serine/threonine-protein kinase n=1 Tax=Brasilonema sennae TaxID=1397703 RepID=UPI00155AB6FA|nr:serine/threonine-protein kinase [Brasilonema sennae]MBW4627157.1 substrate-binding domain-containing protein [Brasilonema octagenarum HA4186-MV1]